MLFTSRSFFLSGFILGSLMIHSPSFASDQEELKPMPPTQWSQHYQVSADLFDPLTARQGYQVLHFSSNKSRPYADNEYARDFVEHYCTKAKAFKTGAEVLRYASDQVTLQEGLIVEMGTGVGKTANALAFLNPTKSIHTFDSYKGLPEDWNKGKESRVIKKGSFALVDPSSDYLPPVLNNVLIYVGDFDKTLPKFKHQILKDQPIALLNIDSDIYSSAKTTFDVLGDNIIPGTVIYLDELYNYPEYKEGEWKALQEYIQRKHYSLEFLAFNEIHEQVAVRIVKTDLT